MTEISPLKIAAQALGKRGGTALYKKYGSAHMSRLNKLGYQKRWGTKKKQESL